MDDVEAALRREFDAEPGTFLLALRTELTWSHPAFLRLVEAMQAYVEREQARPASERDRLDRRTAEGFWYVDGFVRDWSTHPAFPRERGSDDHARACERLRDLAFWYFVGECPFTTGTLPPFGA